MEQMRQPWSVSTAAQEAGAAALKETERWKNPEICGRRAQMDGAAEERLGISYIPSEVNFIDVSRE